MAKTEDANLYVFNFGGGAVWFTRGKGDQRRVCQVAPEGLLNYSRDWSNL